MPPDTPNPTTPDPLAGRWQQTKLLNWQVEVGAFTAMVYAGPDGYHWHASRWTKGGGAGTAESPEAARAAVADCFHDYRNYLRAEAEACGWVVRELEGAEG